MPVGGVSRKTDVPMPRECGGCGINVTFDPTGDYVQFADGSDTDIVDGQQLTFIVAPGSSGSMPGGGPAANQRVYSCNSTQNKFKVSAIKGGTPMNFTTAGSNVQLDSCH